MTNGCAVGPAHRQRRTPACAHGGDADQTVMAFAVRLKDATDLDSVRNDLAGTVHRGLEPAHLSVWVSHRD